MTPDMIIKWQVSIFPWEDQEARANYSIYVEYRRLSLDGVPLYAVTDGFQPTQCLGIDGTWAWDDKGSSDPGWVAAHRFPPSEALKLAREYAPLVRCGGWTAAQRYRERYGKDHDGDAD